MTKSHLGIKERIQNVQTDPNQKCRNSAVDLFENVLDPEQILIFIEFKAICKDHAGD